MPAIDTNQTMLEHEISEIKRKSKIDSNNLTIHAIKGHFPDIATYKGSST
jgi:hypothetical protein